VEDERRRRLDDANNRLNQVGDQLAAGSTEIRAAGLLRNLGLTMSGAADRVEEATSSHAEAEVKVREEERQYHEARKDRRVLELLRERRHEIWKLESSREEQKDIDSQARFQRRTGESA
jgi:flagellar biosynthesis chaperone FliJ